MCVHVCVRNVKCIHAKYVHEYFQSSQSDSVTLLMVFREGVFSASPTRVSLLMNSQPWQLVPHVQPSRGMSLQTLISEHADSSHRLVCAFTRLGTNPGRSLSLWAFGLRLPHCVSHSGCPSAGSAVPVTTLSTRDHRGKASARRPGTCVPSQTPWRTALLGPAWPSPTAPA